MSKPVGRPAGSKNKTSLNVTELWRDCLTVEQIRHCHDVMMKLVDSEDENIRFKAVEFIARRHTVSAEKMLEVNTIEDIGIQTKEQYDELVKKHADLLAALKK